MVHRGCIPLTRDEYDDMKVTENTWICMCCSQSIFPFNHIIDDDSFIAEMSQYYQDIPYIVQCINENMTFNPFSIDDIDENIQLFSCDPDINFYNSFSQQISQCSKYYSIESFNEKVDGLFTSERKVFSMGHLNIAGLPAHKVEFEIFLSCLHMSFSVIAITETWLKDINYDIYNFPGYKHVCKFRPTRQRGGVSIFVQQDINFKIREDLITFDEDFEGIFIEMDGSNFSENKDIIVACIYRPHGNCQRFNDHMDSTLAKLCLRNKLCYFMGDFNLDLLKHTLHRPTADFLDVMYSHSFIPLINRPTRVHTDIERTTITLIDNIYTNNIDQRHETLSGIFPINVSDHYMVWHISRLQIPLKKPTFMLRRQMSEQNRTHFTESLSSIDWTDILNSSDTQDAFTQFHNKYKTCYDKSFPIIKVKYQYNNRQPWLSEDLRTSIRHKNKLYMKSEKVPTLANKSSYKSYKKHLNKEMVAAKKHHYQCLLDKHKQNLGKSWKIIKGIIDKAGNTSIQSTFLKNDKIISDKKEISEGFNDFFVNMGPNLSKKIPKVTGNITQFIKRVQNSIFLSPVLPTEIMKIIKHLKNSSSGWDDINADCFKLSCEYILVPFTHICNLSLQNGIFPDEMKIAKVCPIYKNGNAMLFVQYRPVSVLPVMSKVLEKVMYDRIYNFLQELDLLYELQFGFRPKYSTYMALTASVEKIISALDKGEFMIGVFLDFSKAFDTIDHGILLTKLETYGIRGVAKKWFSSYLSNRYQSVCYNGVTSSRKKISCGVPQGSILGPLLFLIYVNDLAKVCNELFTVMYADDSNLFKNGKSLNNLEHIINKSLADISYWLKLNKLSLNIDKTHFIIFRRRKQVISYEPKIYIDSKPLSRVQETKFLGVFLDEHLTWHKHVSYITNKMSKGLGILLKVRRYLNKNTLLQLYYTFIYPYLSYCNHVWGNTYSTYLSKLLILQKRIIRIITFSEYRAHTSVLFKNLKILKCKEVHKYQIGQFIYKYIEGMLPSVFGNMFCVNASIHDYDTRSSHKFHMNKVTIDVAKRFITHYGIVFWNNVCDCIGLCSSVDVLKYRLKAFLLNHQD